VTMSRARAAVRVGAATVLLAFVLASSFIGPSAANAASPGPTSDVGGDTRSAGEGPGLVGQPILAVGGVIALGCLAAGLTVLYVRATDRTPRQGADAPSDDSRPG